MTLTPRFLAIVGALSAALMAFALPQASRADEFSKPQTSAIEKIVHDYLVKHPEVLEEAMEELQKRQQASEAAKHKDAVKAHAKQLFSSKDQVVLGNPKGNVTFVEFFDYNCGYCKHAMGDMLTLMKSDPNLKVVLKEFPVLGPGSVEAARVAVAVRMQAPKKYLEFHTKLLGGRGQADEARALAVAKEIGLDMTRIRKDMKSPEVENTLKQDFGLAQALGLNGTPSYVVGDDVVVGAVGLDALKQKIANARCGKDAC
jgi:protein-disulfide isomerase